MTKKLTYGQVCELTDSTDRSDKFYEQVNSLYLAMTDWPTGLDDTDELLKVLKEQVGLELSKKNLSDYLDRLNSNLGLSGNGWKAETLTGLLELFQYYSDAKTLDDLFAQICLTANKKQISK